MKKRNQRKSDIYKSRRKKLKLFSFILANINIMILFSFPIFWILKISFTNFQIILFLIFWLVSIAVIHINEKVNE